MEAIHGKQPREGDVQTVYYTGTAKLETGYALCFDHDRGTVTDYNQKRLGVVEKPATGNLDAFAGVVHPGSSGESGPGFIQIYREGPADIRVDVSTVGGTVNSLDILAPQNGSYLLGAPDVASDASIDIGPAQALQETTSDGKILGRIGQFHKVTG